MDDINLSRGTCTSISIELNLSRGTFRSIAIELNLDGGCTHRRRSLPFETYSLCGFSDHLLNMLYLHVVSVMQNYFSSFSQVRQLISVGGYVSTVLQRYLAWFNPAPTIPFATIYSNDSVTDLKAMLRMIPHPLTHIFCKSIKSTLICFNRSSKPCLKQWFEVIDPRVEIWFVRYSPQKIAIRLWKR